MLILTKRLIRLIIIPLLSGATVAVWAEDGRVHELSFFSGALQREMPVSVIAPREPTGESTVLVLLHGRGRNHRSLLDASPSRERLLAADMWVILSQGEDGWYINSPVKLQDRYEDYLDEVIAFAKAEFGLAQPPAQWAITGWSMGGYGAVRYATRHPGKFGSVSAMIGLLDFPRDATLPAGQNYVVPLDRFGRGSGEWALLNPFNAVARLRGKPILLVTADTAFDRTMNENFSAALVAEKMGHKIITLEGAHTFDVVQAALPMVLDFVAETTRK